MIVEVNALRFAAAAVPPEDQAPLPVHADRVEARQIAAKFLEMITWRHPQVLISRCVIDHLQLAEQSAFEIGWDIPRTPIFDKESA